MKVSRCFRGWIVAFVAGSVLLGGLAVDSALAERIELTPSRDASIYQYEFGTYAAGQSATYPEADGTSHLHVGDTNNNNGVQRGLIRFDVGTIPADAIVSDVRLSMTVADVPNRVLQRDVRFWVVPIEGLSGDWAQGPGNEQSAAVPGDATWFHTTYDPSEHGQLGNTTDNPFRDFDAGRPGYWPAPGYLGHGDLAATAPGEGVGGPFDDAQALVFAEGTAIGDVLDWSNRRMIDDVQEWVAGTQDNFGWILVGEEWITKDQKIVRPDNGKLTSASSKIDFFSSETAAPYHAPPTLTVTYTVVPEPSSIVLLAIAAGVLWGRRHR